VNRPRFPRASAFESDGNQLIRIESMTVALGPVRVHEYHIISRGGPAPPPALSIPRLIFRAADV
jgi:hypothetical protein